ncbi:hypothetical protein ACB092_11G174900 [Castanea dentata]
MVAESRPPAVDNQEAENSSQGVKRRLPREIKLKLAKVARLAASQGRISKELLNRLLGKLGHLIQLRTLKVSLGITSTDGREEDFSYRKCLDSFNKGKYPDVAETFRRRTILQRKLRMKIGSLNNQQMSMRASYRKLKEKAGEMDEKVRRLWKISRLSSKLSFSNFGFARTTRTIVCCLF